MKNLDKISRLRQFVDLKQNGNLISVDKYTPLFTNILNNIKNEYIKFHNAREQEAKNFFIESTGVNEIYDHVSYVQKPKFIDAFTKQKELYELPFSITEEIRGRNNIIECIEDNHLRLLFPRRHILRTSYFISNSFSSESFQKIQREHKIWWMRFGSNSGKYSISEYKSDSGSKIVNIDSSIATDTVLTVEIFKLFQLKDCLENKEVLDKFTARLPNKKKEVVPDVIETIIDLKAAAVALIFDAASHSEYCTAFHKSIAPYQLAIIPDKNSKNYSQLVELARFIELMVVENSSNIKVLNACNEKQCDTRDFCYFDEMGVPYNIILDDKALECGLFKLRNRNTTLSEIIHLSDVSNQLLKILTSS